MTDALLADTGEDKFFQKESKFASEWNPEHIYDGFNTRAIINDFGGCFITKIDAITRLKKRLTREIGEEGENWVIDINPITDSEELYLKDSSLILMWKIQNSDKVLALFSKVIAHED